MEERARERTDETSCGLRDGARGSGGWVSATAVRRVMICLWLFSFDFFLVFFIVVFSFLFDNYCPIKN